MTPKFFFKIEYINLIIIVYFNCIQLLLACNINKNDYNLNQIQLNKYSNNKENKIRIESDKAEIHYPNKIELSGNIIIKHKNTTIQSNKLTIHKNNSYNFSNTIIYAEGNVLYCTKDIILTGSDLQFNLNNNNIDLHHGTYHISKSHIYGTASSIMQRNNNRYTIIKKGYFTCCQSNKNYWNIAGSNIIYDQFHNNLHIWNAYLNIKKIPLFYIPYLSLSMNNNTLTPYIPNIQYNSRYGLILNAPFPIIFSKYYSGKILPYYTTNLGFGLNSEIYYNKILGIGLLKFNIIENNINNSNTPDFKKRYNLYWKHHGIFHKKWHFKTNYLIKNNYKQKFFNNFNKQHSKIIDDYINQKILCYYNNEHCKISIAYLNNLNLRKNNTLQNYYSYSISPQLETHLFFNLNRKSFFNFQLFNQFSNFISTDHMHPNAIRIHIEPIINFTINNCWFRFNTETKLNITHYQQNNIDYYIHKYNNKHNLQDVVNRIVPQFKINGKIIFSKKTNKIKKNKYFLEPQLQYLYIPYRFQENIGIYDTKIMHVDHDNLFKGIQYNGLDRIIPTNQIVSNIIMRCINDNQDKFYISIKQILNIIQNRNITHYNNINKCSHYPISTTIPKIKLYSSGIGYWNINNNWNICTEIQYDTLINTLLFGNTAIEYTNNKNIIFQSNYRYINSKYFIKNTTNLNQSIIHYYKTISQFGITLYYPLKNNWIINISRYHNIQSNTLIDQTIGFQYINPCWIFNIIFERNIIDWNNKLKINLYENQIKFQLNLLKNKSNSESNISHFLNSKIIPYQKVTNNI